MMGEDKALEYWYYQIFGLESLKKDNDAKKAEEDEELADMVMLTQKCESTDGNSTFMETTLVSMCDKNLPYSIVLHL